MKDNTLKTSVLVSQLLIVIQNQTHILLEKCCGGRVALSYIFHFVDELLRTEQVIAYATVTLICGLCDQFQCMWVLPQ